MGGIESRAGAVLTGKVVNYDQANWEALENVIDLDACADFMWMMEVELEDGTRIHAYKHWWNRRYVHLSARGEAFVYIWKLDDPDYDPDAPSEYECVPLRHSLSAALGPPRWPEVERAEAQRLAWEQEEADGGEPEVLH